MNNLAKNTALHIVRDPVDYEIFFDQLYNRHAPKVLGFIMKYTDNKEEAEEYFERFFLKIWEEIKTISYDTEKNIVRILLLTCKPLYKYSAQNYKVKM